MDGHDRRGFLGRLFGATALYAGPQPETSISRSLPPLEMPVMITTRLRRSRGVADMTHFLPRLGIRKKIRKEIPNEVCFGVTFYADPCGVFEQ